jgi:hypothetical protein
MFTVEVILWERMGPPIMNGKKKGGERGKGEALG